MRDSETQARNIINSATEQARQIVSNAQPMAPSARNDTAASLALERGSRQRKEQGSPLQLPNPTVSTDLGGGSARERSPSSCSRSSRFSGTLRSQRASQSSAHTSKHKRQVQTMAQSLMENITSGEGTLQRLVHIVEDMRMQSNANGEVDSHTVCLF